MKKEIIASVLAVITAASAMTLLAGCGSSKNDQTATTNPSSTAATTASATKASTAPTQKSTGTTAAQNNGSSAGGDTQSSAAQSSDTQSSAETGESSSETYAAPQMDDNALAALAAAGLSAQDGYVAQLIGTTHNVEGTFSIYAITDPDGNYLDNAYLHASGSPAYYGKEEFDRTHSGEISRGDADAEVY